MADIAIPTEEQQKIHTYQDYLKLPDDGTRYEIIDGELYMSPAPTLGHQRVVRELLYEMMDYLRENPIGEIFTVPSDVILSDINILQPDLLYVSKERFNILTYENVQGAPNLIIEVLSPGTENLDRTKKLKTYGLFGVDEYWMASDKRETVEVWRRKGDQLIFYKLYNKNQTLTTPMLPGLAIQLKTIYTDFGMQISDFGTSDS